MSAARPPADWRARAERAVERGRRLDRWIPAFLLDSPVSRIGYLYGCTVGWMWGSVWSRGRVERHGPLHVFRGLPSWAYPRGGVCVGNCFLTGDGPTNARLLAHEAVHERQWRRYGFLMPVLYALAGRDPLRNRFEIEAGLEDGNYVRRSSR
ncbi:Fe-S oxidoreductase [Microbacterium sp. 18062]|uniref:Fe-S oxidoreductase n=1 Tax=Microbacterium sp. 18062 TaxID=2681410 RepID=UPI001F46F8DA|nr:Fe-S oxidoreductase [Microbacterium sp. 18062]